MVSGRGNNHRGGGCFARGRGRGRGRGFDVGRGTGWSSCFTDSPYQVGVHIEGVINNRATTPRINNNTSTAPNINNNNLNNAPWGVIGGDEKSLKPQKLEFVLKRNTKSDLNPRDKAKREKRETDTGTDGSNKNKQAEQDYKPEEILEEQLFNCSISCGINFKNYRSIQVTVNGEDVPDKIQSFEDAILHPLLLTNIVKSKYQEPTPVQAYAVPIILAGRDVMACAQTGSGKTAAFLLPIIESLLQQNIGKERRGNVQNGCAYPEVVVMSPTRELAGQIKEEARKFCAGSQIRCVAAYGGTSVIHLAERLEIGCNILVATPGRLLDFVQRGKLSFSWVKYLVLDEADRMLDMGFKDEMMKILMSEKMTPKQTLMFSATFPRDIQEVAQLYLDKYIMISVGVVGAANTDVDQNVIQVTQYEKRQKLLEMLTPAKPSSKTLVFVESKKNADFIAAYLCQTGYAATSIHGDRLQPERESALSDFKTDAKPVLVATAVAARGLDIR